MKQIILLFASCLFLLPVLHAQEESSQEAPLTTLEIKPMNIQQELGINGTYFLKQIISLSDTTIAVNPYLLTYKIMFNNFGIRAGVGASYRRQLEEDENFADNTTTTSYTFDTRLGVEYQKRFHPKWTVSAGFDLVYQDASSKFVADSGFDVITVEDRISGFGAGPVLGIYFHLNKHLSLYTEGSFYFLSKKEESSLKFTNAPQATDRSNTIEVTELETYLPATLYLVFRF